MNSYLLDVNVLIALADPFHVHHKVAHDWFASLGRQRFATCPITENGLLRILGNPKYPFGSGTPHGGVAFLRSLIDHENHEFWPDNVTLLDAEIFLSSVFASSAQLTDVYLLGLAVSRGAGLATLDRRINAGAVVGGKQAMLVI